MQLGGESSRDGVRKVVFPFEEPTVGEEVGGEENLCLDRVQNLVWMRPGQNGSCILSCAVEVGRFVRLNAWIL